MVTLDVYVSHDCAHCEFSRELAARAAQAFPSARVQVLELSYFTELPEDVFATPTYLLNGKVVFLGNPDEQELFALLANSVAAAQMSVTSGG